MSRGEKEAAEGVSLSVYIVEFEKELPHFERIWGLGALRLVHMTLGGLVGFGNQIHAGSLQGKSSRSFDPSKLDSLGLTLAGHSALTQILYPTVGRPHIPPRPNFFSLDSLSRTEEIVRVP